MGKRGKIFVSYRRDQSRADARTICQRLQTSFGTESVFMDVDSIESGEDFRKILEASLRQCEVLVAVIGKGWFDATDAAGRRRLDLADDFVRLEIATALGRNIPVIPVLFDSAELPPADRLPADVRGLVFRQAATIRHETFGRDADDLERDIDSILDRTRLERRRNIGARMLAGTAVIAALAFVGARLDWMRTDELPGPPRSAKATTWAKSVRPANFKVEDSPNVGRADVLARQLARLSDGKLTLVLAPADAVSKPSERLDALSRGSADAVWETPALWASRAPALSLFGGQVPFGLDAAKFVNWLRLRGLRELDEVYQRRVGFNVKAMHCRVWPPEGIWFRAPLDRPDQLSGATLRTSSFLLARVADKLGMRHVALPGRELAAALEKGTIHGAEYGNPLGDFEANLHKGARHYYFPSFHAPASAAYLHFNLDRWNSFDEATRGLIEEACETQVAADLASIDELVARGLERLRGAGITPQAIPTPIRAAAERAMRAVADELAATDADFRRIHASFQAHH